MTAGTQRGEALKKAALLRRIADNRSLISRQSRFTEVIASLKTSTRPLGSTEPLVDRTRQ